MTQVEWLTLDYQSRYPYANSQKDFDKLQKIVDKIYHIKATEAHFNDPTLSYEEHKDLIIMSHKLGV